MKRFLLLIAGTAICVCAYAQLARWRIHPVYDSLSVKLDNKLIQGVSGDSIFIWTMDGAGRAQTAQRVLDYREGFAPVMEKDGNRIVGFFDEDGNFTQLKKRVMMAYDNPYFCDGYMIFRNADDSYGYYTTDGEPPRWRSRRGHGLSTADMPLISPTPSLKRKKTHTTVITKPRVNLSAHTSRQSRN